MTKKDKEKKSHRLIQSQKLLQNFIQSSGKLYESIIVLNHSEEVLISANARNNAFDYRHSQNSDHLEDEIRPINFSLSELYEKINQSEQNDRVYYGPKKDQKGHLFFAGTRIESSTPYTEDSTIIVVFNIHKLINNLSNIKIFGHDAVWLFTYSGKKLHEPNSHHDSNPFDLSLIHI